MAPPHFTHHFSWDPRKAEVNRRKHGVSFEDAATVLADPLAVTVYDEERGATDERWVTVGRSVSGALLPNGAYTRASETLTIMKDKYDFSNGARGKFYRKDAVLDLPVYLDPEVRGYLAERARAKGVEINQLVNELLKRDIALIEAAS